MARPQTAPDADIVARVAAYLAGREWPATTWSLAEVAPAAGLSPAGLVKRFGSRAGLLHALGRHWVDSIPEGAGDGDPALELRQYARESFGTPNAAAALAGVTDLLADFADEVAAAVYREGQAKQLSYVTELVDAIGGGRVGSAALAARMLLDSLQGGLLRQASGEQGASSVPDDTIDYFLELWR